MVCLRYRLVCLHVCYLKIDVLIKGKVQRFQKIIFSSQLLAHCVSWRIVGQRRSPLSSPVWHQRGLEPATSCSPSSRWLTACWPVGGTLIWLMLTWHFSWRSANQSSACNSLLWKSFLGFLFVIRFCFCFSASPPLAVAGFCCHGSIAPPLLPSGGRVGGATVIIQPITVSAVIRQERPAVTVFLFCTLLNVDDECWFVSLCFDVYSFEVTSLCLE